MIPSVVQENIRWNTSSDAKTAQISTKPKGRKPGGKRRDARVAEAGWSLVCSHPHEGVVCTESACLVYRRPFLFFLFALNGSDPNTL